MAVESVSSSTTSSNSQINLQDFLRILTSQLTNQDPMKPMDNTEFMAQLAQFTSLEQTRQLNETMGSLLSVQSTTQSVGLIGRTVTVSLASGTDTGQVVSLDLTGSQPQMNVKLSSGSVVSGITLDKIQTVQ
ncbi:flagellar hook assembly protein FlgD [Piscinibacter terrae]|uniref:Basal-body rod modification protein FlgD n=1 Tax=Piscinibacter terrae TaxID=2496871 RepID=A0A3N7K0Z2_9BURK|nr:flagellar hook capping FlgD N-terminal domain-containing protein [Albitalea terrae]RQP26669.1 flagellar hook capping protein [Albitalea terrae]